MSSTGPAWFELAVANADGLRFVFHNTYGEAWTAEVDGEGNVTVQSSDIDWEPLTVAAAGVARELEAQRSAYLEGLHRQVMLADRWVINEPERIWWIAVLTVALQLKPRAGGDPMPALH